MASEFIWRDKQYGIDELHGVIDRIFTKRVYNRYLDSECQYFDFEGEAILASEIIRKIDPKSYEENYEPFKEKIFRDIFSELLRCRTSGLFWSIGDELIYSVYENEKLKNIKNGKIRKISMPVVRKSNSKMLIKRTMKKVNK